jgi:hypothetical protein
MAALLNRELGDWGYSMQRGNQTPPFLLFGSVQCLGLLRLNPTGHVRACGVASAVLDRVMKKNDQ